jgi:hypothetical protein
MHAGVLSPHARELTDARTLARLQLREQLFQSLHLTDEARAQIAALQQVALFSTTLYSKALPAQAALHESSCSLAGVAEPLISSNLI